MKDRWRIVFYEGSMKDLGSMILHKKIDLHRSFMHPSWKDRWRIKKSILHQSFMDPFRKDRGRIAEGSFLWRIVFWWRIDEGSFFYEESIFYERSMKDRFLWRIDEGSFFMKDRWRISDLWSFIKKSTFIDPSCILHGRIDPSSIFHGSF